VHIHIDTYRFLTAVPAAGWAVGLDAGFQVCGLDVSLSLSLVIFLFLFLFLYIYVYICVFAYKCISIYTCLTAVPAAGWAVGLDAGVKVQCFSRYICLSLSLCISVSLYTYIYIYICVVYMYIVIYLSRFNPMVSTQGQGAMH